MNFLCTAEFSYTTHVTRIAVFDYEMIASDHLIKPVWEDVHIGE